MSVMNLKLKVLTKFPASVSVGTGLTLTNTNGAYQITLEPDLAQFAALSLGPNQSVYWPSLGVPASYSLTATGRAFAATASATSGGVPYFSNTTTVASSAALTQHGVVVGGGAGAAPATIAVGATKSVLQGATGADPAFTTTPSVTGLTVSTNPASLPATPGALVQIANVDGQPTSVLLDTFALGGNPNTLVVRKARNTAAAPQGLQQDDAIGSFSAFGHDGTAYTTTQRGLFGILAGGNWSATSHPTYAVIYTCAVGSTVSVEAVRFDTDKSAIFSGPALKPSITNGATLGTATLPFSNHFLGNGTKLDWAAGNVTLTHSPGKLALAGGSFDISGTGAGQIIFPASQNASSNANTLDDYEEGTWTPSFSYATPGDLNVAAYTARAGSYTKVGRLVVAQALLQVSAGSLTFTTASGTLLVTGVPFPAANTASQNFYTNPTWQGITKANYSQVCGFIAANSSTIGFQMSGSGQTIAQVTTIDAPTGSALAIGMTLPYFTT